ncbi:MAG: hypothetical protein ACOY3X_00255 [Pseudomonadota bacterium]
MDLIRRLAASCGVLLLASVAGAGEPVVRVVGPDAVAGEVSQQLAGLRADVDVRRDETPARLVVAVGARAFRDALAGTDVPVVGIALTRASYRQALRETANGERARHTALFWEPDPVRQLRLAKLVLPTARRVGIVAGDVPDDVLLAALRAECARLGLTPVIDMPDGKRLLPQRLATVLSGSDFLLGLDEPGVFSPTNAKTVLLTAYRHSRPVIGPTGAWVDAGSIASLTGGLPEATAALAAWLPALLADDSLPAPRYSDRYTVVTNPQVARSLSLTLPAGARIDAFLRDSGGTP